MNDIKHYNIVKDIINDKQECIPIGCVPPAAVAVWGMSPPGSPPGPDHIPPGVGIPQDQALPWDQASPQDQAPPL